MSIRERLEGRVTKADAIRLASSLVLALLLWGWVTTAQDPESDRTIPNVQIQVDRLPGDLQVISALPTSSITLRGPSSVIDSISTAQVSAHLNLDDVSQPGSYRVPVTVSAPEGVWDHEITPNRITIEVELTRTEQFPLETDIRGAVGVPARDIRVLPEVSEVTVRGPQSDIGRIDQVVLPVELTDQTSSFTAQFAPIAIDVNGQEIPEIEITPPTVEAVVEISARGKSVAAITQLVGDPAQGYEIVDRQVIPATVIVDGPREQLDDLIAIQTEPVDITGVTGNIRRNVRLTGIPDDIQVIQPSDGFVDVVVQVRQRGVQQPLPGQTVTVANLGSGLTAEVNPNQIVVNVVAPQESLTQLPGGNVEVQVDATGLAPGTYVVSPRVSLPPSVQWTSTEPDTVTLTIRPAEAATPVSSTPAATPRATPEQ